MTRISVELVPRDEEYLDSELQLVNEHFPVDTVNIPDLLRFRMRSWEGCVHVKRHHKNVIPHIRAIDIDMHKPLPMAETLCVNNIGEVLVVTGDSPQDMTHKIYPSTSIDIIRKFKRELSHIKVYAGIDQYRDSVREEIEYAKRKLDAGAGGFFTQPFFDTRFMEIYAEQLADTEVFWGVSPVLSEKSLSYWETKNHAIFPAGFEPTPEWNAAFAKKALHFVRTTETNIYFMPIRISAAQYLKGIF